MQKTPIPDLGEIDINDQKMISTLPSSPSPRFSHSVNQKRQSVPASTPCLHQTKVDLIKQRYKDAVAREKQQ